MNRISIDGVDFELQHAVLSFYHCAGEVADWNLSLTTAAGERVEFAGTAEPAPSSSEELLDLVLELESDSLDEVFGALLGCMITCYPISDSGSITLAVTNIEEGLVGLTSSFSFARDTSIDPEGVAWPEVQHATLRFVAEPGSFAP